MLGNNLARTRFGGFLERHGFVRPRRADHTRLAVLGVACRAVDKVTHAVHEPHAGVHFLAERYRNRFAGDEFGLSSHNRFAVRALREFVLHTLANVFALDLRENELIHKVRNKRRFSRADGSHDPDINVAVGAFANVLINVELFH